MEDDDRPAPSDDEYETAGLFEDLSTDRDDRRALLDWLHEMGLSVDDMREAQESKALGAVAGDRQLVPGDRLTLAAASEKTGVDPALLSTLAAALGMLPIGGAPEGEVGITADEAVALRDLHALGDLFSEEQALAFLRVIGSAAARIGETAVSMFLADIESPHLLAGRSELELAKTTYEANRRVDGLAERLDPFLHRHILQAIERTRVTTISETERFQYRYAVGFVDLTGFTARSSTMAPAELARLLLTFESRAYDTVNAAGGRIVKLIGDEVMIVADRAENAVAAMRGLMTGYGTDDDTIVPRGGLAYGNVLQRGGDYFGSVVNLASRLVDEAVPREVLVTEEVAAAVADTDLRFDPAGRRMVKGFAEPVTVLSLAS